MCPVAERLREAVRRRLAAAAEEICELLEETISGFEEETQRHRHALEQLLRSHAHKPDALPHAHKPDSPVGAPLLTHHPEGPPLPLKQEQEDVTDRLCGEVKTEEQVSEFEAVDVFVQSEQQEALSHDTWTDSLDLAPEPPDAPLSPVGGAVSPVGGAVSPVGGSRRRGRRVRECPLCGLRFQSTFNLETHLRVHTGERPFSCSVCGKTFNRKDSLNNHRKIHQGETFCCAVCGKRYSDKSNLRRHAITAHGNANAAHANAAHANAAHANAAHANAAHANAAHAAHGNTAQTYIHSNIRPLGHSHAASEPLTPSTRGARATNSWSLESGQ